MEESRDDWTWRDTLARLQHIDKIIETIVTRAIALNVGLLAALTAIIKLSPSGNSLWILLFLAIAGLVINIICALQLARQECIRRFYFNNLENEGKGQYILPSKYREKTKRDVCWCWWGDKIRYCEAWIYLFIIMSLLFIVLLILILRDC